MVLHFFSQRKLSTSYYPPFVHSGIIYSVDNLHKIWYHYDAKGVLGIKVDGNKYFFHRNALGDVTRIYRHIDDTNYELVARYEYDAWGNHKVYGADGIENTSADFIGNINPIRYRGYYYDVETGLYYLNARYYDPELCRFISADKTQYLDPETVNGLNLFAYCGNNPVMNVDESGNSWGSFWKGVGNWFKKNWKTVVAVVAGVALAAIAVAGVVLTGGAMLVPALIGMAVGAGASLVGQGIGNLSSGKGFFDDINWGSVILGGLAGAAFATGIGGFWGAVGIGTISNSGMAAAEGKSGLNILFSAGVGAIAGGLGFMASKFLGSTISKFKYGLDCNDYLSLGLLDGNKFQAYWQAFKAIGTGWMISILPGILRGISKFLGNLGISWF